MRRPRWYARRAFKGALAVGAIVVLLLVADAVWAGLASRSGLERSRTDLDSGAKALSAGDLGEARARFTLARQEAGSAATALGHPAAVLARALPFIGRDIAAAKTFADSAGEAAAAGVSLTDAATAAGWSGDSSTFLGSDGQVNVDGLRAALPHVEEAASLLAKARGSLAKIDASGLFAFFREEAVSARQRLAHIQGIADQAVSLVRFLPGFLGGDGVRHYLVVLMTLSDPRGSGGYPGEYGILTAEDGKLQLGNFVDTGTLPSVAPVRAEAKAQMRYARWGALTHFIATTYSPDFPSTGRLMSDIWKEAKKPPVDGVIAVDSCWASYILGAIGPVRVGVKPGTVTSQDASELIDRNSFETTSELRSNAYQAALGEALFHKFLGSGGSAGAIADAMSRAASERHLQIWMTRPDEQTVVEGLGVAGAFQPGSNPLSETWDGAVAWRTGYFARKEVAYEATLHTDGSADVSVETTLHNDAPKRPPSILLGRGKDAGYYSADVSVYLPANAGDIHSVPVRGSGFFDLIEAEFGHPVALEYLGAASGGSSKARTTYSLPPPDQPGRFEIDVAPPPALNPESTTITVHLPPGATVKGTSPGATVSGSTVTWQGAYVVPTTVWVEF